MSETETQEPTEPTIADVPEPDQDTHEQEEEEADSFPGTADNPETVDVDVPEPEPQAQGASQAEWEKRFKDAEKRFATYEKAVYMIYGNDAHDLMPVSISPSAPPGFIYRHDAGRVPDDVRTPILEFFGIAREKNYKPDPETRTCPTCDGEGKTETGSKVASFATRACPTCGGRGATGLDTSPAVPQGNGHKEEAFTLTTSGPMEAADVDNWGEPRFLPDGSVNENFGRQPQYKVEHPTYGRTAGLTAQDAAV